MLTFKLDDSVKKSVEMSRLIAEAVASDRKPDRAADEPGPAGDADLSPDRGPGGRRAPRSFLKTPRSKPPPRPPAARCSIRSFLFWSYTWHFATMSLMATQSKSQFLTEVHAQLKRRYKPKPDRSAGRLSVLEAVVYGICHEDTTREQANQALSRFKDQFFDWNEVRVSPIAEVQETLADIPDPQGRAERIRRFLRQLFSKTYGFTLEPLTKKPLKEALKVLHAYEAFSSDYVTATVIQQALGGHAIPIDSATRRALERLGISDPDLPSLRSILERAVPKNRGVEFLELLEELAHDTCVEPRPDCPRCELRKICPFALARKQEAQHTAQTSPAAAKLASTKAGAAEAKKPVKKPAKEAAKERPALPAPLPHPPRNRRPSNLLPPPNRHPENAEPVSRFPSAIELEVFC